ncbi:MAG: 50S ribosomal protein L24 [Chloroflexi bacterium]|nr:50S ribosomal protein L24 [Chloroflexota bacterium]
MKAKIRKGDTVEVISGREQDKGKRGEVIRVIPDEHRVVVQGVNLRKKHQRQVQTQGRRNIQPGIIEFEAPIDISNVMLVCPRCDEPTRVGIQRTEDGEAQRLCKKCKSLFD